MTECKNLYLLQVVNPLVDNLDSLGDGSEDDWRRGNPRFQPEAFEKNKKLVDKVKAIAEKKGCTPAQVALAWVHQQGSDVIPIPGTKRVKYLIDNIGAYSVKLTPEDMKELDFGKHEVSGDRYDAHLGALSFDAK